MGGFPKALRPAILARMSIERGELRCFHALSTPRLQPCG